MFFFLRKNQEKDENMKDKKFKVVNREENYAKPDAPDMQLGRHSRQNDAPQHSTSRRMKAYQARQPTSENVTVNADIPYSADAEIDTTGYEQDNSYTDPVYHEAEKPRITEFQQTDSSPVLRTETNDVQQSVQHKNRTYQRHTQFAQHTANYDFTKEAHSADYSFTEQPETDDAENTEQPDNTTSLPALIENSDDGIARQPESTVLKPEQKKKSYKQYYHRPRSALIKKCGL